MADSKESNFSSWLDDEGYDEGSLTHVSEFYLYRDEETLRVFTHDSDGWTLEREETFDSEGKARQEFRVIGLGEQRVQDFIENGTTW